MARRVFVTRTSSTTTRTSTSCRSNSGVSMIPRVLRRLVDRVQKNHAASAIFQTLSSCIWSLCARAPAHRAFIAATPSRWPRHMHRYTREQLSTISISPNLASSSRGIFHSNTWTMPKNSWNIYQWPSTLPLSCCLTITRITRLTTCFINFLWIALQNLR